MEFHCISIYNIENALQNYINIVSVFTKIFTSLHILSMIKLINHSKNTYISDSFVYDSKKRKTVGVNIFVSVLL